MPFTSYKVIQLNLFTLSSLARAALEIRNAGVIILMLREARDKCLGQGLKMFTPWLPILNDNPPGLLSFCTKLHTGLG